MEALWVFQDLMDILENVIQIISEITNIKTLIGDPELYAGGISSMSKGCFLNPHIDNSHDRNLENFRRLNLLYYVNSEWHAKEGGGELVLFRANEIVCTEFNKPGCAIIFPSFLNHKVNKITSGKRHTLAIWLSGPKFR